MSTGFPDGPGPEVPPGYRVAGHRITGPIGAGGWGVVYAAVRRRDGAPAAVKVLPAARLAPGQFRQALELARREAEFSTRLAHPRLIRTYATAVLHDPGRPGLDGAVVLVMERAERSLADLLAADRAVPPAEAARLLAEVCEGLAHMHGHGWVHGDLKPANVLLMADGSVRLADFGLTAELDGTHAYVPPLGSLDHVPPEWWSERSGVRGVALRPSADVWAFGVLAHQVFAAGTHPFPGAAARARALAAQSYARGRERLRLDERVPGEWRALIADCLAADRAARPADATALAARLPAPVPPARRERRGVPAVAAAAVAALACAAAVAVAVFPGPSDGSGPAGSPPGVPAVSPSGAVPGALPGALPADADVPAALREPITRAARRCPEPEVTPVLLAAMLKAESGFDPQAARPETGEYGIAMWTPAVFNAWAQDGDLDGRKDYMSPPDAIISMGSYVCWLAQQFKRRGLTDDLPGLLAAGYRTSDKTVAEARGVPERVRPHVARVEQYLAEYGR
ncbi:serine/threonine-protein kinase [Streptomyces sp. NRRL B-24484]|uniref:serine/threonine-protein kinase n=1 Tax=Streptomyces sp. NRRL B-24484 TaxID=1463833 RepID=UPI0004C09A91|nr:serine/threonine-protein kinase [Streptomyces sp. NRRL B-24484]